MENYNNFTVKVGKGKYTLLDRHYKALLDKVLASYDENKKERWELYNTIISELIDTDRLELFQELKYRLTDSENPNQVMLDIINKLESGSFLWLLQRRLNEFLEEDFYNRFYL